MMTSSVPRLLLRHATSRWTQTRTCERLFRLSIQDARASAIAIANRHFSSGGVPTTLEELQKMRQQQQEMMASMPDPEPEELKALDEMNFEPPNGLDAEKADVIAGAMQLYVTHGVWNQRLRKLATIDVPVVKKWQKLMELYYSALMQILVNLGYPPDQSGVMLFGYHNNDLMQRLQHSDRLMFMHLKEMKYHVWTHCVSVAFQLELKKIPEMELVDARNNMHRIASKMGSAEILMGIQRKVQKITHSDDSMEKLLKHRALQEIIINDVFLGEDKILEDMGFPAGGQGYAMFQICQAKFEEDPLIRDYTRAGMERVWKAAGLNISEVMASGAPSSPIPSP